jgi:YcaO-like protein with predicted kinase domain
MAMHFINPEPHKAHRDGTHRAASPAETLARVRPFLRDFGITRVANVTGLDRIGVPVAMAYRPNARSLSVSPGKGLTLDAARCSGVMESIEVWHAERPLLSLQHATLAEMRARHRVLDVSSLPHLCNRTFDDNKPVLWCEGSDLLNGRTVWVPFEVVHTRFTLPLPPCSGSLMHGSNGLASGNHKLEALTHGLCELIERDAVSLWHCLDDNGIDATRIDLNTVTDGPCREVIDKIQAADVKLVVWDVTSDVGVPTFRCEVIDKTLDPARPCFPGAGSGCHPTRAIALLRALTEAVQTRLTLITGARDDLQVSNFSRSADADEHARVMTRMTRAGALADFRTRTSHESDAFHEDIVWILERLSAVGIREVVAVDLTRPEFNIPVVRTVVPGLEGIHVLPGYTPGIRLTRKLQERFT